MDGSGVGLGGEGRQSGIAQRDHPDHQHCAPQGSAVHLAGRTQAADALQTSWVWQDHGTLQCSLVRFSAHLEVVVLNFYSATTPELLFKTFDPYCKYRKTPNSVILSPIPLNKWLMLFCDEINLPDLDEYQELNRIRVSFISCFNVYINQLSACVSVGPRKAGIITVTELTVTELTSFYIMIL